MKKKFCAALVCLVLLLTLPLAAVAAGKSIQYGASGMVSPVVKANAYGVRYTEYNHVYFGQYNMSPVQWRVLDANKTNTGETAGMFLLTEHLLAVNENDYGSFHDAVADGNAYQHSNLQNRLISLANDGRNFGSAEKGAMMSTTKSDGEHTAYGTQFAATANILHNDKLFPLSAEEADETAYFPEGSDRGATFSFNTSQEDVWWLRSPQKNVRDNAGFVTISLGHPPYGIVSTAVSSEWYMRPAFNLDKRTVLLMSTAETGRGKETAGMNSGLVSVDVNATTEWKLTLKDAAGHGSFAVSTTDVTAPVGGSVMVSYSGAKAGANEYLSGILFTTTGELRYYGRLKAITTATHPDGGGTQTGSKRITLPADLAAGTYDLRLFSEQYNGAQKTDYASEMKSVRLTVTDPPTTPLEITHPTADTTVPVRVNDAPTLYVTGRGMREALVGLGRP